MVIEINDDEFQVLILLLGIAGGAASKDGRPEILRRSMALANQFIAQKSAQLAESGTKPLILPTFCYACGVVLMGGATQHKADCELLKMIDETLGLG